MAVYAHSMVRGEAHTLTLRHKLEDEIERLIALLDALDGDCDLEPSVGGSPFDGQIGAVDLEGDMSDWEVDQDDEEDYRDFPHELPNGGLVGVVA